MSFHWANRNYCKVCNGFALHYFFIIAFCVLFIQLFLSLVIFFNFSLNFQKNRNTLQVFLLVRNSSEESSFITSNYCYCFCFRFLWFIIILSPILLLHRRSNLLPHILYLLDLIRFNTIKQWKCSCHSVLCI